MFEATTQQNLSRYATKVWLPSTKCPNNSLLLDYDPVSPISTVIPRILSVKR